MSDDSYTYMQLITLNGTAPYDATLFEFNVIEGGALQILDKSRSTIDLIGPGFWVAVVHSSGEERLDWDFLAPKHGDA